MRNRLAAWREGWTRVELAGLLGLTLLALAVWGFAEIADEVMEGDTRDVDRAVVRALRSADDLSDPWGPRWLEEMGRDYTALGGMGVLALVTAGTAGFLALRGNRRTSLYVVAAVGAGAAVSLLLKEAFDRPRPDLVPHLSEVYTSSFPSGHSMLSALTYLTLAGLVARHEARWRVKAFVLGAAVVATVLVGASRVYLGVHYPTDVLAGWAAGAAWALLCVLVARRLSQRGELEAEAPEEHVAPGAEAPSQPASA